MDPTPPPRVGSAPYRLQEGPVLRAPGGVRKPSLYAYTVFPDGAARAVVGLLHGYADHGGRYAHVTDRWAGSGIASITLDLRGHGRAEGRRGYCDRFHEFVEDAAELTTLIRERAAGLPAFLVGHSFGGLVAISSALADPTPWRGLVLSSPYVGLVMKIPTPKRVAGELASLLWPTLSLPSGLTGTDVTLDAERAKTYDADPLVFSGATVRWFTETRTAQAQVLARAPSITLPLYVAGGTKDRIADLAREKAFFDAASSTDKTFDLIEGGFHELLNDPEWAVLADRIAAWILTRAT